MSSSFVLRDSDEVIDGLQELYRNNGDDGVLGRILRKMDDKRGDGHHRLVHLPKDRSCADFASKFELDLANPKSFVDADWFREALEECDKTGQLRDRFFVIKRAEPQDVPTPVWRLRKSTEIHDALEALHRAKANGQLLRILSLTDEQRGDGKHFLEDLIDLPRHEFVQKFARELSDRTSFVVKPEWFCAALEELDGSGTLRDRFFEPQA